MTLNRRTHPASPGPGDAQLVVFWWLLHRGHGHLAYMGGFCDVLAIWAFWGQVLLNSPWRGSPDAWRPSGHQLKRPFS